MKILLYESITAVNAHLLKNNKYCQFSSLLQMGLSMRNALENDLKNIKNISYIIGKHNPDESMSDYLRKIKPEVDAVWIIAPETNNELIKAKEILYDKPWVGCQEPALNLSTNKSSTKKNYLNLIY